MWRSTLILIICFAHGVLPGPATSIGERKKLLTPLESMTSDLVLNKCGVPQNAEDLAAQLTPLAFCDVKPFNVPDLDKTFGTPFVCSAIHSLLHYWCETHGPFVNLLSAIRDSKSIYKVDDACAVNGGLSRALKPTDYVQVKPFVERLQHEFTVPGRCQKICFDGENITVFCKYLLIINEQLELSLTLKKNEQYLKTPKVSNTNSNETVTVKPKEEYVEPSLGKNIPVNPHLKAENPPTDISVKYESQSKASQTPKTQSNPTETEIANKIPNQSPESSVNIPPPKEELHDDLSHENQLKHDNLQLNSKNVELNIQSNKDELNPLDIIDLGKTSNDRQKTTLNSNVNDQVSRVDYEMDDESSDDNEELSSNVASNKDIIQPKILDTIQQDNSKDKIDNIVQSRANDIYRSGMHFEAEDSNFFTYFLFAIGVFILGYVIFHNKNKVLGLLVEGRRSNTTNRRRGVGSSASYRKLDCTLEEAVSSAPPSHGPNIVY